MSRHNNAITADRPASLLPVVYIGMAISFCVMCVMALSRSW